MKPEDLYHTGIVVDDLDATLDWFTKVAGYRWTDVVEVDQVAETPHGVLGGGPTGGDPADSSWNHLGSCGFGVHHLGYWSDDVESDLAALETTGMQFEVKAFNPDGSGTMLWAYCKGPAGPRIELVSRAMKPFIEYWFATAEGSSE